MARGLSLDHSRPSSLPKDAPALLCGTSGAAGRHAVVQAEVSWNLPSLAPSITSLLDVTVADCQFGDLADAALASSTRFIELDATAWTTSTVRVRARNISPGVNFHLAAATLSVAVMKRQVP